MNPNMPAEKRRQLQAALAAAHQARRDGSNRRMEAALAKLPLQFTSKAAGRLLYPTAKRCDTTIWRALRRAASRGTVRQIGRGLWLNLLKPVDQQSIEFGDPACVAPPTPAAELENAAQAFDHPIVAALEAKLAATRQYFETTLAALAKSSSPAVANKLAQICEFSP